METDEKRLRRILDLARTCVLRGQGPQALAHLDAIRIEVEDLKSAVLSAEFHLTLAGALGGMKDQTAEFAFADVFEFIRQFAEPNPGFQMRAHEEFGKYLAENCSFKRAREQYRLAEKIAEILDLAEDQAHLQMCVIGAELREQKDPRIKSWQNLKKAATTVGANNQHQRDAWIHYVDEFEADGRQRIAARKGEEASVEYFQGVLSLIRRRQRETVK